MAINTSNIHGFNISGNNTSTTQFGHFMRKAFSGDVSGCLVKQNTTPNMTVLVEDGIVILTKNSTSSVWADIKTNTNVSIATADTSNPRIDSIIVYEDTSVALPSTEPYLVDGEGGRFKLASITGTASANPQALSDSTIQSQIGANNPFVRIADVRVGANSTTIINSNITDRRNLLSNLPKPAKPAFMAYANANIASISGQWTQIRFHAKDFDIQNNYSTSNYLFTAPEDGIYCFSAGVEMTINSGESYLTAFYKNGSEWKYGERKVFGGNATYPMNFNMSVLSAKLNKGDTISVWVYNSSGGNKSVIGNSLSTWFSGYQI